jgi:hypothetical protein
MNKIKAMLILALIQSGTAWAQTRSDCGDLDLSGEYRCKIKGETLDLILDQVSDELSVRMDQGGQTLDEQRYVVDGGRHRYREPGRIETYAAHCMKDSVVIDEFIEERRTNRISFTASREGLAFSVEKRPLKVSCKRLR